MNLIALWDTDIPFHFCNGIETGFPSALNISQVSPPENLNKTRIFNWVSMNCEKRPNMWVFVTVAGYNNNAAYLDAAFQQE